jgi:hypothetical protein
MCAALNAAFHCRLSKCGHGGGLMYGSDLLTGRPDEFVKNLPKNVDQTVFVIIIIIFVLFLLPTMLTQCLSKLIHVSEKAVQTFLLSL